MAGEVLRVLVQAELLVERLRVLRVGIEVLPGARVLRREVLHVNEEVAEAALLEHAHQVGGQGFFLIDWYLKQMQNLHTLEIIAN